MLHTITPTTNASSNQSTLPTSTSNLSQSIYQFSTKDWIALLEAERFNLRAKCPGFVPHICTRAQKARAPTPEKDQEISNSGITEVPSTSTSQQEPLQSTSSNSNTSTMTNQPSSINDEPEHPFRNARDANYLPPQHRNVAVLPKTVPKKAEPTYRNQPPIQNSDIASTVYHHSLDAPVTLTQHELLSIAPDVHSQYRDATTPKQNVNPTAQVNMLEQNRTQQRLHNTFISMPTSSAIASSQHCSPPEGSTIIPDRFEQYYRSLGPGEKPDHSKLVVAKESAALRSIFPSSTIHRKSSVFLILVVKSLQCPRPSAMSYLLSTTPPSSSICSLPMERKISLSV